MTDFTPTTKLAGKKASARMMADVEKLVKELPDKLAVNLYTASLRDFLWTIIDQQKRINSLEAFIAENTGTPL